MLPDTQAQIQKIIRSLEATLKLEYPHHLLVRQREALVSFLGIPCNNFHRLQSDYSLLDGERKALLQPIADWYDTNVKSNVVHFPDVIQGSINRIRTLAGVWAHGVKNINTVEVLMAFTFDWGLLREYEALLRRTLVRTERSQISSLPSRAKTSEGGESTAPPVTSDTNLADASGEQGDVLETLHDAVFRRQGDVWLIRFSGATVQLRDSKGLRYIARLLSCPGTAVLAVELASEDQAGPSGRSSRLEAISEVVADGDVKIKPQFEAGCELADGRTLREVNERMRTLAALGRKAEELGDEAQKTKCDEETRELARYLDGAAGLRGRPRTFSDASDRARKAVGNRIRLAMNRLMEVHPTLARHLGKALKTGRTCSYSPDEPVRWDL